MLKFPDYIFLQRLHKCHPLNKFLHLQLKKTKDTVELLAQTMKESLIDSGAVITNGEPLTVGSDTLSVTLAKATTEHLEDVSYNASTKSAITLPKLDFTKSKRRLKRAIGDDDAVTVAVNIYYHNVSFFRNIIYTSLFYMFVYIYVYLSRNLLSEVGPFSML